VFAAESGVYVNVSGAASLADARGTYSSEVLPGMNEAAFVDGRVYVMLIRPDGQSSCAAEELSERHHLQRGLCPLVCLRRWRRLQRNDKFYIQCGEFNSGSY
jgi:hypothetical protein